MSRLRIKDILKSGARVTTRRLMIRELVEVQAATDRAYAEYLRLKEWDPELMNQRVTI